MIRQQGEESPFPKSLALSFSTPNIKKLVLTKKAHDDLMQEASLTSSLIESTFGISQEKLSPKNMDKPKKKRFSPTSTMTDNNLNQDIKEHILSKNSLKLTLKMPMVQSRSGSLDTRSIEARIEQEDQEQKKLKNIFPNLPQELGKKVTQ